MAPERGLALFDLDSTLLPIDSDHAWNEFMVAEGWVDADSFRAGNDRFYADYVAGTLDIAAYIEFAMRPLRARATGDILAARDRFVRDVIGPTIRPEALALIESHRARGDRLAIVSATHTVVVEPIVEAFGLTAAQMIATELERDAAGRPTGRIAGVPAFREGKVARIRQWLLDDGGATPADYTRITAYSDSPNDLPMLELATEPVATNPSPALAAIARARGWRTLQLFGNAALTAAA